MIFLTAVPPAQVNPAHMGQQRSSAVPALPWQQHAGCRRQGHGGWDDGDAGTCGQWSCRCGATLVRHDVGAARIDRGVGTCGLALAPAPRARGVCQAATPAVLIALRGLTAALLPGQLRALPAAVELAAVAVAAQQHLRAAASAQEQAGGSLHEQHLGNEPKCWTPRPWRCNTGAALTVVTTVVWDTARSSRQEVTAAVSALYLRLVVPL